LPDGSTFFKQAGLENSDFFRDLPERTGFVEQTNDHNDINRSFIEI